MSEKVEERELIIKFKSLQDKKDSIEESLKSVKKELEQVESQLIEMLESQSAEASARYEGIGYVRINKPRLYANCKNDDMEKLFGYLETVGRTDLIKTTVAPQSLSSFVSESIGNGVEIPPYIGYYLKQSIRLYNK